MNQPDLIQRVFAAEQQAQALTEDAKSQRQNLDQSITEEIEAMRARQEKSAEEYLTRLEASEQAKRQQVLSELDSKLNAKLQQVESIYAAQKDQWIETIFDRIIGRTEA